MRKENRIAYAAALLLLAGLLPPVFSGCGKTPLVEPDSKVSVPLYLSVGEVREGLSTKMQDRIVQNDDPRTFRGIQNFYVVPFTIPEEGGSSVLREHVRKDDECLIENVQIRSASLPYEFGGTSATRGYYTAHAFVANHSNAVLAYGQATEESSETVPLGSMAFKRRNGSIIPNNNVTHRNGTVRADALSFDLESCLYNTQGAYDTWKLNNQLMLNAIAGVELQSGAKFREPSTYNNDLSLSAAFRAFTYEIFSTAGEAALLTALYNACHDIPAGADATAKLLAAEVCTVMEGYTTGTNPMLKMTASGGQTVVTLMHDPYTEFNLPNGAVAWQWGEWLVGQNGSGFGSPGKSEGVNLADPEDYCFPPALWYYVNSPLMGSTQGNMQSQFEDRTHYPTWSDIVSAKVGTQDCYTRGITLDCDAALIRDPLQYAVGLLKLQLAGPYTPGALYLEDRNGNQIPISGKPFPLTGIIIGGQRTQNFDFTASTADMRFLYDVDMNDANGEPMAWISTDVPCGPVYTLSLPTREHEDIQFALEFRNDSGVAFSGARGAIVLPGSTFYLIGHMLYNSGTADAQAVRPPAVFVKDCITTLTVRFEALASAYTILPELTSPDLQMGVSVRLSWDAVTPFSYELQ